uniref:Chloroplast acetyl-CoA carboxylase biotin-containing subunit n=1 Tax=Brassica napus TaxID=3708 RepID=G4WXD6_BRANA|nr:chloroplast acetyl-CoA carboxylase biotin-containing subunit [Brassica napus]
MASSSFSVTSPAASVYGATQASSQRPLPTTRSRLPRSVSFRLSAKPKLRFLSKPSRSSYPVVKAQSNQVGGNASSKASAPVKIDESSAEEKDSNTSSSAELATEESISEFLTQVTTLVKLVDSRDIVELQLKQLDCELVIRKKEALPQAQTPAPYVMMQQPNQPSYVQATAPPPPSAPAPSTPAFSPPPSPPSPAKSSLPTVKSPMAGTFYRSPGPGEPPFVGDKVQKGQVLCIVEAMKLMNEIESDQTGTVVDIVAEDGKPVSLDTPLFVVQP